MNLTPAQIHTLAAVLRSDMRRLGVITISRADDPGFFDAVIARWSDEDIILQAAGDDECDAGAVGIPEPKPAPERDLAAQWESEGVDWLRAGKLYDAIPAAGKKGPRMRAGFKAERLRLDRVRWHAQGRAALYGGQHIADLTGETADELAAKQAGYRDARAEMEAGASVPAAPEHVADQPDDILETAQVDVDQTTDPGIEF